MLSGVFANNMFILGSASGNIYNEPTLSTYIQVFTGTNSLNGMGTLSNEILAVGNNGAVIESFGASSWATKANFIIGQNTTASLFSVYPESANSRLWVTGVNALAYTPVAATPGWTIPGLNSITKYTSGSTNTYLATDNQTHIFSSTNRTSWTTLSNPSNQVLNQVTCSELKTCIAVGQNGTILKSVDGSTWTQITSPTTANLTSVACQFGVCVAVGGTGAANSGIVLLSTNALTNWVITNSSIATTQLHLLVIYWWQSVIMARYLLLQMVIPGKAKLQVPQMI